jgi:hypothetical protein
MTWHGQVVRASEDQDSMDRGTWMHQAESALRHIHWFRKDQPSTQKDRPDSGSSEGNSMDPIQYNTSSSEYAQAMRSIRAAKNVFWMIAVLSILIQSSVFILVHVWPNIHCHVLQTTAQAAMAPAPATEPAAPAAPVVNWANWASWSQLLHWLLPVTMFVGAVSSMLLALTILFGVLIALLGRRPGLATMISAFFWSLILLAAMIPWQQVMPGNFVTGATFNLADLKWWESWSVKASLWNHLWLYGRFLGFLVAALLVAVVVQAKFAIASRAISGIPTISLMPEKPV